MRSSLAVFLLSVNFISISSRHIQFYLNGYECFYQEIRSGTKCSVEYAPISGSKPHVDATIEDPNQYVFYKKTQQEYDFAKFVANITGTYRVCFSNIYDMMMFSNVVYLDFVVGDEGQMIRLDPDSTTPLTRVETSIVNIYDGMKVIELYQNHHRIREANGRLVGQALNEKVMMWSVGQALIGVVIGVVQVYTLKWFFAGNKDEL